MPRERFGRRVETRAGIMQLPWSFRESPPGKDTLPGARGLSTCGRQQHRQSPATGRRCANAHAVPGEAVPRHATLPCRGRDQVSVMRTVRQLTAVHTSPAFIGHYRAPRSGRVAASPDESVREEQASRVIPRDRTAAHRWVRAVTVSAGLATGGEAQQLLDGRYSKLLLLMHERERALDRRVEIHCPQSTQLDLLSQGCD